MSTKPRLLPYAVLPDAPRALLAVTRYLIEDSTLDERLPALVQLRASQINGCGFCTVLHANEARDADETNERLVALPSWREIPWFSEREEIALEWTECLTKLAVCDISDELYERALTEFGERSLIELTLAVAGINAWNRVNGAFRVPPNNTFREKQALSGLTTA
jgi:AhpD family alkylhydroperoxidase